MQPKLRIARATNRLPEMAEMYSKGLDFIELGRFENHAGFSGIMLGSKDGIYHFEFTSEFGHSAPKSHSPESLLVFYFPDLQEWEQTKTRMKKAGFTLVKSHNPYWNENGVCFEDPESYRIVLCHRRLDY